jgi:hypothetical protein
VSDEPRWPNDGPDWPSRDLRWEGDRDGRPDAFPQSEPPVDQQSAPPVESGDAATAFNGTAWDPKLHGERRRPTTAEQAVPWLIGITLALAGIVIVLMALIFTGPDGLLAGTSTPRPSGPSRMPAVSARAEPSGVARATATPEPSRSPKATSEATPTPAPEFGPLEMVYLGRPSALAPIHLLRRDFSRRQDPDVMAQADAGVSSYAWSPDGRYGAAIINERLVGLEQGERPRPLADGISAAAFGWDSETVYAVRIRADGTRDVAEILEITFRGRDERRLASVRYPRPVVAADPPLREAQFIDDGGRVRLYAAADGNLVLWILGAPQTYRITTGDGTVSEARRQPVLWASNGLLRVDVRELPNGTTNLVLQEAGGDPVAKTTVPGLVSHVRWVETNNEIVFTLGRLATNGGVRQDLYVWDLQDGRDPMPLTSDGVSFGAEWLGSAPNWLP